MKDVKKELASISTALTSLMKKVEKMVMTLEKESGKAAPKKKAKAAKKAAAAPKKKAPAKKAKAPAKKTKAPAKKGKAPAKKKAAPKATSKAIAPAASGSETMLDNILGMISRSRGGITVDRLKKRTGLESRQVSNALYKLSRKGLVETIARGVYVKKKK